MDKIKKYNLKKQMFASEFIEIMHKLRQLFFVGQGYQTGGSPTKFNPPCSIFKSASFKFYYNIKPVLTF